MKRIALILLSFACLQIAVSAAQDNIITGPYNISFDLGIPIEAYAISMSEPYESESSSGNKNMNYRITLEDKTKALRVASINLIYYIDREYDILNAEQMNQSIRDMAVALKLENAKITVRKIDRTIGGIAQADFFGSQNIYLVEYQTPIDPQHLLCYILSTFPWEEGTLSLLKTIHIEKINATA